VHLDLPPPREVPDDERILRDRKERQLKLKEAVSWQKDYFKLILNLGNERDKREDRERLRLKNK